MIVLCLGAASGRSLALAPGRRFWDQPDRARALLTSRPNTRADRAPSPPPSHRHSLRHLPPDSLFSWPSPSDPRDRALPCDSRPPLTRVHPRLLRPSASCPPSPLAPMPTTTSSSPSHAPKQSDRALLAYIYSALGAKRQKEREQRERWSSLHSSKRTHTRTHTHSPSTTTTPSSSAATGSAAESDSVLHSSWQTNGTTGFRNLAVNGTSVLATCSNLAFDGLKNELGQDPCYVSTSPSRSSILSPGISSIKKSECDPGLEPVAGNQARCVAVTSSAFVSRRPASPLAGSSIARAIARTALATNNRPAIEARPLTTHLRLNNRSLANCSTSAPSANRKTSTGSRPSRTASRRTSPSRRTKRRRARARRRSTTSSRPVASAS